MIWQGHLWMLGVGVVGLLSKYKVLTSWLEKAIITKLKFEIENIHRPNRYSSLVQLFLKTDKLWDKEGVRFLTIRMRKGRGSSASSSYSKLAWTFWPAWIAQLKISWIVKYWICIFNQPYRVGMAQININCIYKQTE